MKFMGDSCMIIVMLLVFHFHVFSNAQLPQKLIL
jgi:hypothetical protein